MCIELYDQAMNNNKILINTEISKEGKNKKRDRMAVTTVHGFNQIKSAFNGMCKFYFKKNLNKLCVYKQFLETSQSEIKNILSTAVVDSPIKYNLKLEATYKIPNTIIVENRAFKTSSRPLFLADNIDDFLKIDFIKILQEIEEMDLKGSGFSLDSIDGILLNVNKYTPTGGSSYIALPMNIENRKATINVQNNDEKCFKYCILAKLVNPMNNQRVGRNYSEVEDSYNFSNLEYPVRLTDIKKFEKNNPGVSVNVYSIKKGKLGYKNNIKDTSRTKRVKSTSEQYIVYPVKVCEKELDDHHDLLLFGDGTGKQHYCRITNLVKLIGFQITRNGHGGVICKRCFKVYSEVNGSVSAAQRLKDHKLKCDKNKPLMPLLPKPNSYMKFKNWGRTQKHPFCIYADLECLLKKEQMQDTNQKNTNIIHHHDVMSYCYYIKPTDDVPIELLEKFNIKTEPVVFKGNSNLNNGRVAKKFMEEIVKETGKIEKLLQTNIPIILTPEIMKNYKDISDRGYCPLCKLNFNSKNVPVRDHNHLNGKYRGTVCNNCNILMRQPKFVPCFFHNLSGYDSHFLIRQLGFDSKSITVIPNTEEKFISFTKFISNNFQIRFIDTFRFMASSLASLASNLLTSNFEKFRDTAKVFSRCDMDLVTRKGIYPYEYTDNWAKLDEVCLPPKEKF